MPTLTVSPNPADPSTVVSVQGSGFANAKTRLLLDGQGATTNIFRPKKDGTFAVGITVSSTAKTQSLIAQQQNGSTWTQVASTAIVVQSVTPVPPPTTNSVNVSSVAGILSALADDTVDEIVVANGTYSISGSGNQASNSLWIGSKFASRTRPITVRAQTTGGVIFDAGGGYMGGMSINGGAHDQTWDGFQFANGTTSQTGVIVFGGYSGLAAPYNITLRNFTIQHSVHRVGSGTTDHAVYFSYALEGWKNILVDHLTVDASDTMGLATAIHMDHGYASDAPNVAAHDVTVTNLTFTGNTSAAGQQALILWQPPTKNWLFDTASITNAGGQAVRFESIGASNIVFKNITSVNSHGFYSSLGNPPPGVTITNCSFG
jgi:hypothetical protein